MDDFINVIKKDPQIRNKMEDYSNKYKGLPYNYQSKTRYDHLIQNVNLKELINIMGTTITGLDINLKLKFSRKEFLESKSSYIYKYTLV